MWTIRDDLMELRRLRIAAGRAAARASEYLERATRGMSYRRATDIGGTGSCPLTEYALRHDGAREEYRALRRQADALWARLEPVVAERHDLDAREVMRLYYDQAQSWEDVRRAVKRSEAAVWRLHRDAVARMERR